MKQGPDSAGVRNAPPAGAEVRPRAGRKPTGMRRVGVTVQLTPDEIARSRALWVG